MTLFVSTETILSFPPPVAFACWTQRDQIKRWWGENGVYHVIAWVSDLRPGGSWRALFEAPDGSHFGAGGDYGKVLDPHCLEWTWCPDWHSGQVLKLVMTFSQLGKGTRFAFSCDGFRTEAERDEGERRWHQIIGWLDRSQADAELRQK